MKTPPMVPDWERVDNRADAIGVDRKNAVIRGYVVAQEGPFKSTGRGEFDRASLDSIMRLMRAAPGGTKVRFTHPDMSNDGLGKFLGRSKNPRLDTIRHRDHDGELLTNEIAVVRADLHFDKTALDEPVGGGKPLGAYVMDLAESDPDALSSSLVLQRDEELRLDRRGRPLVDNEGIELPPLWRPTKIHASDIVAVGDAVDGFLSADSLPDAVVRRASEMLERQFSGRSDEFIRARCVAWLDRHLANRRAGNNRTSGAGQMYDSRRDPKKLALRRQLADIADILERRKAAEYTNDTDPKKIRLRRVVDSTRRPGFEMMSFLAVDGEMPTDLDLARVRAELARLSLAVRESLYRRGARLDVIIGSGVTVHADHEIHAGDAAWDTAPGAALGKHAVVVANLLGKHDSGNTVLHEVGHLADAVLGFPSAQHAWKVLWEADRDAGRIAYQEAIGIPEEHFAESFALCFKGTERRGSLSDDTFEYMKSIEAQLTESRTGAAEVR